MITEPSIVRCCEIDTRHLQQETSPRTHGVGNCSPRLTCISDFHQLKIRVSDCHKTTFTTPFGLYEFVSVPFGLANTPGYFQHFMNHVLRNQIAAGTKVVYCDDVCIFTKRTCPLEHMTVVEQVLDALREHQLGCLLSTRFETTNGGFSQHSLHAAS